MKAGVSKTMSSRQNIPTTRRADVSGVMSERRAMVEPHDEGDQPGPDKPVDRRRGIAALREDVPERRRDADQDQGGNGPLADRAVTATEEGVTDAAAVELARGEEVERRDEEAGPRRVGHRVGENHEPVRNRAEAELNEQARQERVAEGD